MNNADDFKYPRRRPWLLLAVLVIVAVSCLVRYRGSKSNPVRGRNVSPTDARYPLAAQTAPSKEASRAAARAARNQAEQPPAAAKTAGPAVEAVLAQARACEQAGDLTGARTNLLALLKSSLALPEVTVNEIESALGRINILLVTTPAPMPEKIDYIVKKGDSLEKIARKFGTTVALLQKSNELPRPDYLKAGDRLRVLTGKFSLTVSKSRNDMVVHLNGDFFKRYPVGTGKYGKTPTGTFVVRDKVVDPVWWHPDGRELPPGHPENILGSRWIALKATGCTPDIRGYGIHGTTNDATVGKAESAGCVRMRNADVEELFDLIPLDTPVVITD